MESKPVRLRARIEPAKGVSTPLKVSDSWSRVRPSAIGVSSKLCRPSKMPGSPRRPIHSRKWCSSTAVTRGLNFMGRRSGGWMVRLSLSPTFRVPDAEVMNGFHVLKLSRSRRVPQTASGER